MPDDHEWTCVDDDGAVVCKRLAEAAGIVPGPPDPGWICGEGTPRICVDLKPDLPGPGVYRCMLRQEPVWQRRCERDPAARVLGRTCTRDGQCPDDAHCDGGTCQPTFPIVPGCYQDADCGRGRCRFGTCLPPAA